MTAGQNDCQGTSKCLDAPDGLSASGILCFSPNQNFFLFSKLDTMSKPLFDFLFTVSIAVIFSFLLTFEFLSFSSTVEFFHCVTARLNDCDKEGDDTSGLLLFRIFINRINYNQNTTFVQEQKQKGCCSQESGRANLVPPGVPESEMNVARPFKGHSTPGRGVH